MRFVAFFLFILSFNYSFSQTTVNGIIKDVDTKAALAYASIFIANSKIGTVSSANGAFSLNIPQGKYDLIVSNIGYETQVVNVDEKNTNELIIYLKEKQKELDNIKVTPYEKDGWKTWGKFFTDNFIGTMNNSFRCNFKNYEVIKFRRNKKKNTLSAVAFEPLVIENKALGYVLKYQMEAFIYNFSTRVFYYEGYPLFIEMEGNEKDKRRWEKNRASAYYGSMLHFMRAIYRNKIAEEGFEMHKLVKQENKEKMRIKKIFAAGKKIIDPDVDVTYTRNDSTDYYEKVLRQPDELTFFYKPILPADSVAYAIGKTTAGLSFSDYLDITYTKEKAPVEYSITTNQKDNHQTSQITLLDGKEIAISANGNYYPTRTVFMSGYWSWSEKIGFMLPMDYWPQAVLDK